MATTENKLHELMLPYDSLRLYVVFVISVWIFTQDVEEAIVQKWVPYSQRYLFNAIPDTNHNANPTNPNRYSKGNPNPTNPNTRYRCE